MNVEQEAKRFEEMRGTWHTTDYEVGDTLFFPALTTHKALPNVTEDRLRISLDNRYHPIGGRIAEHMLKPHLYDQLPLEWEEVNREWESDDLKYYWRDIPFKAVRGMMDTRRKVFPKRSKKRGREMKKLWSICKGWSGAIPNLKKRKPLLRFWKAFHSSTDPTLRYILTPKRPLLHK